jgi:hypothetical protein
LIMLIRCATGASSGSKNGGRLIVGVCVDDLIITDTGKELITAFKIEMKNQFQMSDLRLLSYYLGIEVQQRADGIKLSQSAYASKLLERCGLADCNPSDLPMESRLKLSKQSSIELVGVTGYKSIIRALCYLLHTWSDLAFPVGYLSQVSHLVVVKHVLRYVAGTKDYMLHYTRHEEKRPTLVGYSDADMVDDADMRKSTSSIVFFLGGNPVTWQSTKKKVVALSSCEAEYVAAASAACQGV